MIDILNLAPPYFGLIFIGFACGISHHADLRDVIHSICPVGFP